MKISRRKDGRWRTTVKMPNGSYKSIYGKTKTECKDKAIALEIELSKSTFVDKNTITLGAWCETWIRDYLLDLKPRSKKHYQDIINNHIIPYFHRKVRVQNIKKKDIQGFIKYLLDKGLQPKTIKSIYTVLHSLLDEARKNDIVAVNPCQDIALPKIHEKEITTLNDTEIQEFIDTAYMLDPEKKYADITEFLLHTGLRRSEVLALCYSDFDRTENTITIDKQLSYYPAPLQFIPTKNNLSRVIFLTPRAKEILENRYERNETFRESTIIENWNEHNLFFINGNQKHISQSSLYHFVKKVGKAIGRPELRVHDLRHTYASICLSAGMDIKTIQLNLGHSKLDTTVNIYLHSTLDMQRNGRNCLSDYLAKND